MLQKAKMRKIFAALLAVVMVLAAIAPAGIVKAAEKVPAKSVKFTTEGEDGNLKVLVIGKTYQLAYTLSPKNSTDKVTFKSGNEARATVTSKGLVTPKKAGAVSITAKTTSGETKKITYLVTTANGTTSMQSRIAKVLAAPNLERAAIRNLTSTGTFKIAAGDYSNKSLNIRTPKADVENYGTFKDITITDVKSGTWHEFGKNNSFEVKDNDVKITVDKAAVVKTFHVVTDKAKVAIESDGVIENVNVTAADSELAVVANGDAEIKNVVLDKKADLVISGDAKKVVVTVGKDAEGSKLTASMPVEVSAGAKVDVILEKGAEGSTFEKTSADVKIKLDNQTTEKVAISTKGSDTKEIVNAGGNNSNIGGGGTVAPPADPWSTINGVVSGSFTVYTLAQPLSNVKIADVVVNVGVMKTTISVSEAQINYLNGLLTSSGAAIASWQAITAENPVSRDGITVTGISGDQNKKLVSYNAIPGVTFQVVLNVDQSNVTITKWDVGQNQAVGTGYSLYMDAANNALKITSDVSNKVTFKVQYK